MSYQHILVPVDGSPTALSAITQAAKLAITYNSQVTVILVISPDVLIDVESINTSDFEALDHSQQMIKNIVDEAKAKFTQLGVDANTLIVSGYEIDKEIVKAAHELHIDLVVMGSHGSSGFKKLILGSVTEKLLRDIHVPVLVVRPEES